MKRFLILLSIIFYGFGIYANPRPSIMLQMTELYFDSDNKWNIELSFTYEGEICTEIDTSMFFDYFFLYSLSDTLDISGSTFYVNRGIIVIIQDSLKENFQINRYGDIIGFVTSIYAGAGELKFGNINDAFIDYPKNNQSISLYNESVYVKDNSPSIGYPNSNHIWGTLQGCVYDMDTLPIPNHYCQIKIRY